MGCSLILHHYPLSPFSEKIRLMLGAADLHWKSLLVSPLPPRPATGPLTGGYRRIPVAQFGADMVCDSQLIAEEISQISAKPFLAPSSASKEATELAAVAESTLFFDAASLVPPKQALSELKRHLSLFDTARFLWDRLGIARETRSKLTVAEGAKRFRATLAQLDQQIQGEFLFGDRPGHADFALYHPLWFLSQVGAVPLSPKLTRLSAWYDRMSLFGHGHHQLISAKDALAVAAASQPRGILPEFRAHPDIGKEVIISPTDYAKAGTRGQLAGVSDQRWILRRETGRFGTVHVHFPRQGYRLSSKG
ncbi:glutathione S-transferase family protein [Ferrimonas futtsuensis]|uniref:glutathione S-transferase family protein n=1 Tax=Ferrimonas futtsuensis TaxID=364764 RepID=UPI00042936B2|nr:glutathione S-transferase family protein [Ferrimonas futtsuensis]